ncbi:hypothetical protein ACFQI7_07800 [Paenibacillus allorhizosphaerae]|uniref:Cell division coordinator CpoB n=1 Tax=Paenibacillus allorhizosphaerae TaxID=2849866 RepID=A0ABN7TJE1_9BACL|nr:hypothetical protein [Paenibacillus allorhizosphaerae]CAG7637811.1 Cell division coordinator CpoB [Paenibacillus allorhizosphaerae]
MMKRLSRLIALTVTAALTAASIPLSDARHSAHAMELVKEPVWPEELVRTVSEAKEAYERKHVIPPELSARLTEARELLLPTALQRLTLRPAAAKDSGSQQEAVLSPDWRFWAATAQLWNDKRLLPALLDWTASFPLETYESEPYVRLVAEILSDEEQALVLRRLESADANGTQALLGVMRSKNWLVADRIDEWLAAYRQKPQQEGILNFVLYHEDGTSLIRLVEKHEHDLTSAQKLRIISRLVGGPTPGEETTQWLRQLAAATGEPAIEQTIDQALFYSSGDREAAERLYRSGTEGGFAVTLNGRVEKALTEMYPSGELAAGARLYESIRGKPYFYFEEDGWYNSDGKDYYAPEEAIGLWLDFLERYPKHPGADDAAYRLARCYQKAGDSENAMLWLIRAAQLGDRDLGYDASGMLLFVLDVEMSSARLEAVRADRLPAWMKPWLDYSMAVEYIREKRYREAARSLQSFIDTYQGKDLFTGARALARGDEQEIPLAASRYPFWEKVGEQLQLAERMAKLTEEAEQATGTVKADGQYALAAAIYREPLLYYNHLWRGERQSFFWLGGIKSMDYNEPLDRYIGRFNHLIQAIEQFQKIDVQQANAQTAAKMLFSIALSYSKLAHYGEEVSYHTSGAKLNEKVTEYAKLLAETFPDSELADDALMLIYSHTKDKRWLEQIVARYPQGDRAEEAGKQLEQLVAKAAAQDESSHAAYDPGYMVRYEQLRLDDKRLPSSVRSWVEEQQDRSLVRGTMTDGDWVYVLVTADEGKALDYLYIGNRGFRMIVSSNQSSKGAALGLPSAMLARVKSKFVPDGEWQWQMYGN